mmetsp:Transcript_13767/g.40258  ORF Transcript_13767/g.40258 Transcript_13767/m.40258 type:complete len:355 (-) Transcript_13767:122-1186(-)
MISLFMSRAAAPRLASSTIAAARPLGMMSSLSSNLSYIVKPFSSSLASFRMSYSEAPIALHSVLLIGSRSMSTVPSPQEEGEIVTFLTLNSIRDNPGSVKKVGSASALNSASFFSTSPGSRVGYETYFLLLWYIHFVGPNKLSSFSFLLFQKRRIGRGVGSSKGKTCGRGHKGQKARAGGSISPMFEGGQTPLYKTIPKRGFRNTVHAQPMVPINVETLENYVAMGRLIPPGPSDPPLTIPDFINAGIVKKSAVKHGVKLLGGGADKLKTPLRLEVSRASKSAIDAIERAGGEVVTVHYNKLALKALMKPDRFDIIPRRALPPPKLMPYYTNYDNRGYLSPEVQMKKVLAQQKN